ncbi:MAG: GNAT family N-acetyltransferase [Verrucomicrobiota bacterium]
MSIEVQTLTGGEASRSLAELARLRIEVFREYPYVYDGDETSEELYLSSYLKAKGSVMVLVWNDGEVVGVSTGLPLTDADEAFRQPFEDAGEELGKWFYFGESVLRKDFRGRGLGHRFFDERESHAMKLGFHKLAFCSVLRPEDHPLKPVGHRPHDLFWGKRGFIKQPALRAKLAWPQVGSGGEEVENELVFWTRCLEQP